MITPTSHLPTLECPQQIPVAAGLSESDAQGHRTHKAQTLYCTWGFSKNREAPGWTGE